MLQLDAAQRIVTWKTGKKQIVAHTFRRLREDDWDGYFSRILIETIESGEGADKKVERTIDTNSAAIWLWERCCTAASGYVACPDWRSRVPLADRLQAVKLLAQVSRGPAPEAFEPECEIISLDCLWTGDPGAGAMQSHMGLLHRLALPSAEQMMRYSRETSRSLLIGGSRTRRTRYPASQRVLISLYDELIRSVDGYAVNGHALSAPENIKHNMDAMHKVAAVAPLFATAADLSTEEGDSE